MRRAYTLATVVAVALFAGAIVPHILISGVDSAEAIVAAFEYNGFLLMGLFVGFVLVHEFLHGVGFHYFAGVPWRDIRYGIKWKYLTPYATTSVAMPAGGYRWSALLPGILTGLLPAAVGTVIGDSRLVSFAAFMASGAGGDVMIVWLIRKLPAHVLIRDSAHRIGCEVVDSDFA